MGETPSDVLDGSASRAGTWLGSPAAAARERLERLCVEEASAGRSTATIDRVTGRQAEL